jgi:hypothetical protein
MCRLLPFTQPDSRGPILTEARLHPSEFNRVVAEKQLSRAGCWSHLRTYFFRALVHHPIEAKLALATIRELFMIERDLYGLSSVEDLRPASRW